MKKFKAFNFKGIILLIIFTSLILDMFFYIYIKGLPHIEIVPAIIAFTVFQLAFISLILLISGSNFYIPPFYFFISIFSSAGLALFFYELLVTHIFWAILGLVIFLILFFLLITLFQ